MHMAAVRWSLLPRNQQCPRNIRCALTENSYRSQKIQKVYFHVGALNAHSRANSRHSFVCSGIISAPLEEFTWKGGIILQWECAMAWQPKEEARGGLQIHLCQVALPHPTQSRSTRDEQTLGVRLAKQSLTQSESRTPWLMFVLVIQRLQKMWLLATFIITISLVKHTGIKQFSVVSY